MPDDVIDVDHEPKNAVALRNDQMPAMTVGQAVELYGQMKEFVGQIMEEGRDYGTIPGNDKKILLQPGAEKLATFFGFRKVPVLIEAVKDWTGQEHGGEPFFEFNYRVELFKGDRLMAAAEGSCNSFEKKYRYREDQRKCPECGKTAIIKGKKEYGGGWLCWKKKDGCGATFKDDDVKITGQSVGQIPNPDVADLVNTIQKMAQKRALVSAVKLAVDASNYFTVDIEEGEPDANSRSQEARQAPKEAPKSKEPAQDAKERVRVAKEAAKLCGALTAQGWTALELEFDLGKGKTVKTADLLRLAERLVRLSADHQADKGAQPNPQSEESIPC